MAIQFNIFLKFLIIAILFQYVFKKFVEIDFLDTVFSQLDDLLYLCMIVILISNFLLKTNQFSIKKSPVNIMLLVIIIWSLLSLIINNSLLINFILFIKNYFLIFIIYYFILFSNRVTKHTLIKSVNFMLFIFSLQVFIQLIQLFIGFTNGTLNDDSLMGSFSGANNLGYALFIPLFYLLTLYINKIKKYIFQTLLISISFIFTFAEFAFVSLPFFYVLYNAKKMVSIYNIKKMVSIGLVLVIVFTIISLINPQRTSGTNSIFKVFSPEFLVYKLTESEFDVYSGSARMLWFPITYDRLNDSKFSESAFVGMGPGMYASFAAFKLMPYTNESIYNIFGQLEKGLDPNVDSQIIPIWGELGHVGLFLFILFYLVFSRHHYINYKKSNNQIIKSLNLTVSASSLYLILGLYVNHVLESQTIMATYLIFMAVAEKLYRMENYEKSKINFNTVN